MNGLVTSLAGRGKRFGRRTYILEENKALSTGVPNTGKYYENCGGAGPSN